MNAEEYFEEHHVPRHSKLIKGCGLLYQESEIPKLMEAYHQEQVKKLNIDDVMQSCDTCKHLSTCRFWQEAPNNGATCKFYIEHVA